GLSTRASQAANGDAVLAGQSVSATAPTRISNTVSLTPDSTADGLQGYATGANNSGLFGRNNSTDGIGVSGAAPSGTGVFGESSNGFGVGGKSDAKYGVYGKSNSAEGVYAESTSSTAARGVSTSGVGGSFAGGLSAIRLVPAASGTGAPTAGAHLQGELYVDSAGTLFYCTTAGTPGTWQQVALGSGGGGGMTNPMTTQNDLIIGGTSGAPARLAKGSNGQILTVNGSGNVAWATPSGGGSGDSFMAPLTAPPSSGWSWLNQGSSTTSRVNSAEVIEAPAATSHQIRERYRSLASGTYTLTTLIAPTMLYKNYVLAGIFLRESSSSKLICFGAGYATGTFVQVLKFTSESAFSANYVAHVADATIWWLRIQGNGSNRICSTSKDGRAFVEIHSVSRTDFITPDQVGFFVNAYNQTTPNIPAAVSLISWNGVS
ncbi:MAG: hypothetical protein IT306_00040, partial [Chloroflexi bacterium]|nr:hypothetical protein [Chloroflexota bacterium]